MSRSVPEWIGKSDDSAIPPRVRLRVWDRELGRCHRCTRDIEPHSAWIIEHLKALINGGENREANLCLSCEWCKPQKDREDVAIKSTVARKKKSMLGIPNKTKSRPMPGSKASGLKKRMDGTVVRR